MRTSDMSLEPQELLAEEKLFYERFYTLHGDPDLLRVFKEFGIQVFRRSSVLEGFADLIEEVGFKGHRCVEIGTHNGLTAIVLARYFTEVITIDIAPSTIKHQIAKRLGVVNIRFVDVRDNAEKYEVLSKLKFTAAYLDGDHANDTRFDFRAVQECGNVLFHEYWRAQEPVWDLVNELKRLQPGSVRTKGKFALWRCLSHG